MKKNLLFYGIVIVFFSFLLWLIIDKGVLLESLKINHSQQTDQNTVYSDNGTATPVEVSFVDHFNNPLGILILQILAIILVARIFGILFNRIGQPTVIGEITAGIFLGPSVVGMFFPEVTTFLFPASSLSNLQLFSQIGLIFFMFMIGMELDLKILKNKAYDAIIISHASIVFPYFLGVVLAYFIYTDFAPDNVSFLAFALFIGISMSITAFPVLARIIQERGLTKSPLGTIAITCAAADDITAWCILAVVIAIVKAGSLMSALITIGFSVIYVLFMLRVLKPFLHRIGTVYASKENINKTVVAVIFITLLASSYISEIIGIHALFGAFLAGVVMPHNLSFKKIFLEKIEDISLVFLLPLFFVYTGLRTEVGLINSVNLLLVCFTVIAFGVVGKFGGSVLAARFVGQSWKDSLSIGALMNTRGLMELVVLNIGYDLGILSAEIFTAMVIMALVTTLMTAPSLHFIDKFFNKKKKIAKEKAASSRKSPSVINIMISFGAPKTGSTLLKLADLITFRGKRIPAITALHITPSSEISPQSALIYEKEVFNPIKKTAQELGIPLKTTYKSTADISSEIISQTKTGNYDLLLVGSARSVFSQNPLGGIIKSLMDESPCNIGVMIDKGFRSVNKALLLFHDSSDTFLLELGLRLTRSSQANISVADVNNQKEVLADLTKDLPSYLALHDKFQIIEMDTDNPSFFRQFDLVLVGPEYWKKIADTNPSWMELMPTILLIKQGNVVRHQFNPKELFANYSSSSVPHV